MSALSPKRQVLLLILLTAVVYIILARPVEDVTRFVVVDNKVYLTAGPAGFRILDIVEEKVPAPSKAKSLGIDYILKPVPKMTGSFNTLGHSNSLVVRDNLALIADGGEGVIVLDITDPHNLKKVGDTEIDGNAQDLALWKEEYAYVAAGRDGLRLVKIKKNGEVSEIKEGRSDERADVTRINGDRLYVGGDEKLKIFDLKENAKKPELVGSYSVNADIQDIQIVKQDDRMLAYLAADRLGVLSLDVSKPVSITEYLKFDTPGRAMGVFVYDGYALVADGNKGLRLYDLAIKDDIRPIEPPFETWGETTQVAVKDSHLYLADGASGLRVLEYLVQLQAEPQNGVPQATAERAIVNADNPSNLYLADGGRGLRVLRSNNLQEVSFYDTPGYAGAAVIRWQEGRAVVADKNDLLVLDITELKNPNNTFPQIRLLGALGQGGESDIYDVQLSTDGRLAYVANGAKGFWVVDISDPAKPKRVGNEALAGQAVDLEMARGYAYIAGNLGGLIIVNSKDSNTPARVFPKDPGTPFLKDVMAVDVIDRSGQPLYVYTASQEGFCVVRFVDPEQPVELNCQEVNGSAKDVMVDVVSQRAYLVTTAKIDDGAGATKENGFLYVYSVAQPDNPQQMSVTPMEMPLNRVTANGELVYLSSGDQGLRVVNVQNPVQIIATYNYPPLAKFFVVRDQFAYVTDGAGTPTGKSQGLSIVDLSDKKKPRQVGVYPLNRAASPGEAFAVALHPTEKVAYLADGSGGLQVINIADPARPSRITQLPTASSALHLALKDKRLYLALGDAGLWVMDISNPRAPFKLGELKAGVPGGLPGAATWLGVYDDYVIVANRGAGLSSVLVQDGRNPQLVGTNTQHLDVRRFVIRKNRLYAGAGADGMVIYNLDRPSRVEEIKTQPTVGPAEYVYPEGSYAFVAMAAQGIQVFLIENETRPIPVGASLTPNQAVMLQAISLEPEEGDNTPVGYFLFAAEGSNGLRFYHIKKDLLLFQSSVYETPGTAYFWEVFNFIVTRINGLVNQTRDLLKALGLGFLDPAIKWVQGKFNALIKSVVRRLGTDPWPLTGASPKAGWTLGRVLFFDWLVLGWFGMLFWAAFVAQFVLPVQGLNERDLARRRLWAFIRRKHGTMTRVYDGQVRRPPDDAEWSGPGVALVDVVSAVVLEKRIHSRSTLSELRHTLFGGKDPPPDAPFGTRREEWGNLWNLWGPLRQRINRRLDEPIPQGWQRSDLDWQFHTVFGEMQRRAPVAPERVEGRRLVFTQTGGGRHGPGFDEVVAHSVDLRKQFRISGQEVLAHTRNGIELRSLVFCLFTLGEKPETLQVTYLEGRQRWENIRVVYWDEVLSTEVRKNGKRQTTKRYVVKELIDELDPEDKQEIHSYVQACKRILAQGAGLEDCPPLPLQPQEEIATGQPFLLDRDRVFAAAASRADDRSVDNQPAWHELPVRTAIEVYRNLLLREDYDNLYSPTNEKIYPMKSFKTDLSRRVRNLGLINFQYIERKDCEPLQAKNELDGPPDLKHSGAGGSYTVSTWYPARPLTYPKALRARGIKVITAGSTEMRPVDEEVRRRFLETWRARWLRDAEQTRTDYEMQAQRIRTQARIQAQRDMIDILTRIFASGQYSREAMALRVFQALEGVAADPLTRQFLPEETIYMLRTLEQWLLPEAHVDPQPLQPPWSAGPPDDPMI